MLGPSSWTFGNNSGWTLISYKCLQQRFEIGRQKPGTCFVPSRELLDLVQPFSWTAAKGERWRWRGGNCIAAGVLVSFCPGCSWICHEESWRLTLVGHREHDCWVVLQCFGLLYSNSIAWICVQNTYYTEMHFIAKSLAPSRCLRIKTTMPNMGRGHTWSPWWLQILTRNQFSSTKSR